MWSCGAAQRGVFSLVTAMHRILTRLGEDVVGGSVPLLHGGTLREIILCYFT